MTAATRSPSLASSGQHALVVRIVVLTLLAWVCTAAVIAIGGRPDPSRLRAVAPLIDGAWKFQVGDDPRWAGIALDDSSWETLDLSAPASSIDGDVGLPNYVGGWMAHGHSGYQGYAWYRRTLAIPKGDRVWDVLGPTAVEDGYELYWNGKPLGGSGRLGESPRVVGTRPMIFSLPSDAAGTQGVIAIRAFMQPGSVAGPASGGIHVAPTLAPQPESRELYRVQWWRSVAGYIVEVVEPLAMAMVIVLALSLRQLSSHQSVHRLRLRRASALCREAARQRDRLLDGSAQPSCLHLVEQCAVDAAQPGGMGAGVESLGTATFAGDRCWRPCSGGSGDCRRRYGGGLGHTGLPPRHTRAARTCRRADSPPWVNARHGTDRAAGNCRIAVHERTRLAGGSNDLVPVRDWRGADPVCVWNRRPAAGGVDRAYGRDG
ncbi:hypothetical protein SAMN02744784_02577 [Stenotrophomonas sp. CC120223-11]|nr:hypothetical protein SAMN02744784_02577 [Stenotrophomonas sp. CC120223-11]